MSANSLLKRTSVVIPAKNEGKGLALLLPKITQIYPELLEIIVIDDGSTDNTMQVCQKNDVKLITHRHSMGNGAAIKSGARSAKGEFICFMDGDGQHKPESIIRLIEKLDQGFDLVVGARKKKSQASMIRYLANLFYNHFASLVTGFPIQDLTSGLRVVNRKKFLKILYLLPNGFSYPTTSTMAFLRSGYRVEYLVEDVEPIRIGKSHISPIKDGIRFLIIIFKIGTLYSPLKVFSPLSFGIFLMGISYYLYTFINSGQLTNMSVILFTSSIIIFLIGLVSEQINSLMYMKNEEVDE